MLKKWQLMALVVCWPSYSYSESINPYFGITDNAASTGLSWDMGSVLPAPPGLDIQGVIYSYRIRKEDGSWATVYVQNERADGLGYIFREQDDWMPGSQDGTEINRVIPIIPGLPRELWGPGSIDVEGGSVEDARVFYQYRVDPCFDPQANPACPGYEAPLPSIYENNYAIYDALAEGHARKLQYSSTYSDEEEESEEEKEARKNKEARDGRARLEKALSMGRSSSLFAAAFAQSAALDSLALSVRMDAYYNSTISGGTYDDSITLRDAQLPDSPTGQRNGLAQQLLHQRMIEMQY
jgi:hypothetical protein